MHILQAFAEAARYVQVPYDQSTSWECFEDWLAFTVEAPPWLEILWRPQVNSEASIGNEVFTVDLFCSLEHTGTYGESIVCTPHYIVTTIYCTCCMLHTFDVWCAKARWPRKTTCWCQEFSFFLSTSFVSFFGPFFFATANSRGQV